MHPQLWGRKWRAPGIFGFFLLENPHAHKIPPFRGGGGGVGFWASLEKENRTGRRHDV